ncbi:hypothetical protein ROBYS_16380 [Roseobacter sp. OBYS 0001]|nr:hypothetical protein ROBYS_16380 [Roseobacter sp. OBYS 0001]
MKLQCYGMHSSRQAARHKYVGGEGDCGSKRNYSDRTKGYKTGLDDEQNTDKSHKCRADPAWTNLFIKVKLAD